MEEMEYRNASYAVLSIMLLHAPDINAQALCSRLYNQSVRELGYSKALLKQMTGLLFDGLAYGNWPWPQIGVEK